MLTLASTETLQGKATEATKVTATIVGDQVTSGASVFKVLEQKQISNVAGVLYESPSGKESLISQVFLVNSGAEQTVELFIGGTAAANQIARLKIPLEGSATLDGHGWQIYDKSGKSIYLQGTAGEGLELTGSNEFKVKALGIVAGMLGAESVETAKIKLLAVTEGTLAEKAVAKIKLAVAVTEELLTVAEFPNPGAYTSAKEETETKPTFITMIIKTKAAAEKAVVKLVIDGHEALYEWDALVAGAQKLQLTFLVKKGGKWVATLSLGAESATLSRQVINSV